MRSRKTTLKSSPRRSWSWPIERKQRRSSKQHKPCPMRGRFKYNRRRRRRRLLLPQCRMQRSALVQQPFPTPEPSEFRRLLLLCPYRKVTFDIIRAQKRTQRRQCVRVSVCECVPAVLYITYIYTCSLLVNIAVCGWQAGTRQWTPHLDACTSTTVTRMWLNGRGPRVEVAGRVWEFGEEDRVCLALQARRQHGPVYTAA